MESKNSRLKETESRMMVLISISQWILVKHTVEVTCFLCKGNITVKSSYHLNSLSKPFLHRKECGAQRHWCSLFGLLHLFSASALTLDIVCKFLSRGSDLDLQGSGSCTAYAFFMIHTEKEVLGFLNINQKDLNKI